MCVCKNQITSLEAVKTSRAEVDGAREAYDILTAEDKVRMPDLESGLADAGGYKPNSPLEFNGTELVISQYLISKCNHTWS